MQIPVGAGLLAKASAQTTQKPLPTRGRHLNNREANTVIKTLTHLPHPHENAAALAGHFTDLAPPLNDRQAHLEASRCLYLSLIHI